MKYYMIFNHDDRPPVLSVLRPEVYSVT